MAGGLNTLLQCQGKVNANNALMVSVAISPSNAGTGASTPQAFSTVQGKVDANNNLVMKAG